MNSSEEQTVDITIRTTPEAAATVMDAVNNLESAGVKHVSVEPSHWNDLLNSLPTISPGEASQNS